MSALKSREREDASAPRARTRCALLALGPVAVASALHFHALDVGLRHEPDYDEAVFVEQVLWMIRRGDWVPRFFEYPGFLFWILRVVFAVSDVQGADAYFAARAVMAAFSVASVFLASYLAARWFSFGAGAFAGLLLAFSPLAVETAHAVRADVVIGTLLLATLAAAAPLAGRPNLGAAFALGATAFAVKFSAALAFPVLVADALRRRTPLPRLLAWCGLAALTFFVLSPWTFLVGADSAAGMTTQLGYHYATDGGPFPSLWHHLSYTLPLALSTPGLALAISGAVLARRSHAMQTWCAFIALWILVFSTTDKGFLRFMVPLLGLASVMAARGLSEALDSSRTSVRVAAGLLSVAALISSARTTLEYLGEIGTPSTRDLALDWIEALPEGSRVLAADGGIGRMTAAPVEIVATSEVTDLRSLRHADAVILFAESKAPAGFKPVARFVPAFPKNGRELVAWGRGYPRIPEASVTPASVRTTAPQRDPRLIDGQLTTRWRSDVSPATIEIELPPGTLVEGVELAYGGVAPPRDQIASVLADGSPVSVARVRGPLARQRPDRPLSEWLSFEPVTARRLVLRLEGTPPLIAGELRVIAGPSH